MIRGLYHDNYCGFASEPPPTELAEFPLGTLTYSDERAAFLAINKDKVCAPADDSSNNPDFLQTVMELRYNTSYTPDSLLAIASLAVLKMTYDAVFPDHPFSDNATPRCIGDAMVALSLESTKEVKARMGHSLSLALRKTPFACICDQTKH
jgi:hypothetical protein